MSGTKAGGALAAKTNKEKYGADFYHRIGKIGGAKGTTGGFAANKELARRAGAIGGKKSRRGKSARTIKKAHADFQEGMNQPSWKDKVFVKLKKYEEKERA